MRFLCLQPDHHYQLEDDADVIWFFSKTHCDEDSGMDMMNIMAKTGKIDRQLWDNQRVIVSQDLLDSIKDAYRNRNTPIIEIEDLRVNYKINEVNDVTNKQGCDVSDTDNPQRKEKEIKENKKKTVVISDDEWLKTLEDNPTYQGLEVRVLYGRMCVWCETNGKRPTRRRFVNWLNREDKPLAPQKQERPHYVTI